MKHDASLSSQCRRFPCSLTSSISSPSPREGRKPCCRSMNPWRACIRINHCSYYLSRMARVKGQAVLGCVSSRHSHSPSIHSPHSKKDGSVLVTLVKLSTLGGAASRWPHKSKRIIIATPSWAIRDKGGPEFS